MFIMTYSQARQNFSTFLDRAKSEGEAIVKRADGSQFKVIPIEEKNSNIASSPFSKVVPVSLKGSVSIQEIIDMLHEDQDERADRIINAATGKSTVTFFNSFNKKDTE